MKKEANRSTLGHSKKRLYLVFLVFGTILGLSIFFSFLIKLSFTGLAFGIPEENNFTETNNSTGIIENGLNQISTTSPEEQNNVAEEIPNLQLNSESNFRIQDLSPGQVYFNTSIPSGTEVKYLDYKFSNYSSIILITKQEVDCIIKPDSTDDGWKNCTAIFEVENTRAAKPNVPVPNFIWNHTNKGNRNLHTSFSNISTILNFTYNSTTTYEKRNFTNFTASLPSILVTSIPFAIKLEYESPKFGSNIFNLSTTVGGFNIFIDPDQSACGTLSSPGTYTLTQNLNSSGTCFTISSDYVDLNCNGFTINSSTAISPAGRAIYIQGNHTIIRNCNTFEGSISQSAAPGIQIDYYINNITIGYSNITTYSNNAYGIQLTGNNSQVNLTGNSINTRALNVILLTNSSNNTIYKNIINGSNASTIGISLIASSIYNVITGNSINTTSTAVDVRSNSDNNNFTSNSVTSGTDGFDVRSAKNKIDYNSITITTGTSTSGVTLNTGASNLVNWNIINVNATNNGRGITFLSSDNNVSFNQITNIGPSGFGYLLASSNNNNTAISDTINATGSDIQFSDNNNITLINVTFTRSSVQFSSGANGSIFLKRYVTINVSNYTLGGLNGSSVEAYNVTFKLLSNSTASVNGNITTLILDEYMQNATGIYPNTPHQFNASKTEYATNFTVINLSSNLVPLDIIRTIYLPKADTNAPSISISSSGGTSFYESTTTTLTCSGTDSSGMGSVSMTAAGSNVCSGISSCSGSITPGSGIVTVTCTAADSLGNSGSSSLILQVAARPGSASGSPSGGGGGPGSNTETSQTNTQTTTITGTSEITTSGSLINSKFNSANSLFTTDSVQSVITGNEAQQIVRQDTAEETSNENARIIIPETNTQIENPEVIAVVKTEQGNSITVNKGTVNNRIALGLVIKTKYKEKVNLRYNIESKEGLDKPKLDLSFNNLNGVKVSKEIKNKIIQIGDWSIVI